MIIQILSGTEIEQKIIELTAVLLFTIEVVNKAELQVQENTFKKLYSDADFLHDQLIELIQIAESAYKSKSN